MSVPAPRSLPIPLPEGPRPDASGSGSPLTVDIRSVYQPIVALDTRAVVGFEALARVPNDSGWSSIADVFRAAEHDRSTAELDWRCRLAALHGALAANMPPELDLFVNTEPDALDSPPPAAASGLLADARRLSVTIEITERHLMRDPAGLLRSVERARDHGWRVAIDDVGADPSSLALLALLRPDVVKLDMRLVQGRSSATTASIIEAVSAETERTGAVVIAEGIETLEHEQYALDMGATRGQGWLYGEPGQLPPFPPLRREPEPAVVAPSVTVRAPVAQTPFGVAEVFGRGRRAGDVVLDAIEDDLFRTAVSLGQSTMVLVTIPSTTQISAPRRELFDVVAARTALTAVFHSSPPAAGSRYRAVAVELDEPLAAERSVVIAAPSFTAALLAVDRGSAPDGGRTYGYSLIFERGAVLDAATVLLRRVRP